MNAKASHYLQKFSIYIVLVVLFIACSFISPYFLQSNNLINVARQLSVGILIAYGEMLLIISGFLDLSVGSVLALSGVLSVSVYKSTQSFTAAIAVALAVAVGCNLVNALFVANFKVPSRSPADWRFIIPAARTFFSWAISSRSAREPSAQSLCL